MVLSTRPGSVRIDAMLVPHEPTPHPMIERLRSDLSNGMLDGPGLEFAVRDIIRAEVVHTAEFNTALNQVLRAYGVFVTPVHDHGSEMALSYGAGYSMSPALQQAKEMRQWFVPAVESIVSGRSDSVRTILGDLVLV